MKISVMTALVAGLVKAGYDVARISNSLNSSYHDGTKVDPTQTKDKIVGTKLDEKAGEFIATESTGTVRRGIITAPLRFIHWQTRFEKYLLQNGGTSGDLSADIVPTVHRLWLDQKFTKGKVKPQSATEKRIAAELVAATKAKAKLTPPVRANKPGKPGKASVDSDEQNSNGTPETVKA